MKTAVLSDVHGNWISLQSVLHEIEAMGCERIICLGDVFGYMPDGAECLNDLCGRQAELLLGNHEAMLLGHLSVEAKRADVYGLSDSQKVLSTASRRVISRCLPFRELVLPTGKRMLLVHGSPWDPLEGYVYPDRDLSPLGELDYDYVFMGHTHHAFQQLVQDVCVVNTGSCGLPRDVGDQASFAVYDSGTERVDLVRVPLDIQAICAKYSDVHPSVLACFARQHGKAKRKGQSGHG